MGAAKGPTVLLVDDEQPILHSLRRLLRREGWNLLTATSAAEGLEAMAAQPVDLVMSDIRMPGGDGIAFLRDVKEQHPGAVRVILTGYAEEAVVVEAFRDAIVHEIATKPWEDEELRLLLRRALAQVEQQGRELQELAEVLRRMGDLPALPRAIAEVRQLLRGAEEPSAEQVATILMREPAVAAKVLQVANSAIFGQRRHVDTLSRAVVVIGLRAVEQLVTAAGAFGAAETGSSAGLDREALWTHSMACGLAARLVARAAGLSSGGQEQAAIGGILHDLGKLVFDAQLSARYFGVLRQARRDGILVSAAETSRFGVSHANLGGHLADWWGLPEGIGRVIRCHHQPAAAEDERLLAAAVHLADVLAHRAGAGSSGNGCEPPVAPAALQLLGLDEEALSALQAQVPAEYNRDHGPTGASRSPSEDRP